MMFVNFCVKNQKRKTENWSWSLLGVGLAASFHSLFGATGFGLLAASFHSLFGATEFGLLAASIQSLAWLVLKKIKLK